MSLEEFKIRLTRYVEDTRKQQTIKTNSGIWMLKPMPGSGVWEWISKSNPDIMVQATPFHNNLLELPFDSYDIENIDSPDPWGLTFGSDFLTKEHFPTSMYLDPSPTGWQTVEGNVKVFLNHIYRPLVKQVLDGKEVQQAVGGKYTTWEPTSYVSSYAFKYPPKKGTVTQLFTDYIKQNPRLYRQ